MNEVVELLAYLEVEVGQVAYDVLRDLWLLPEQIGLSHDAHDHLAHVPPLMAADRERLHQCQGVSRLQSQDLLHFFRSHADRVPQKGEQTRRLVEAVGRQPQ